MNKYYILKSCKNCEKPFSVLKSSLKHGKGHFCSKSCKAVVEKPSQFIQETSSIKIKCKQCNKLFKTKWFYNRQFCSHKCYWKFQTTIPEHEHPHWKGKNCCYGVLHRWVYKHLGTPNKCEFCKTTKGKFHWANKSGKYKRKLNDWIRLCIKCHKQYDLKRTK